MTPSFPKINIGVSACLLGEKVRFDGGHKSHNFTNKVLAKYSEYRKVCPEVGMGMSIPRRAIRLIDKDGRTHLVDRQDSTIDHTDAMEVFASQKCAELTGLNGFILTSKSPSCGMERIKVYTAEGNSKHSKGVGLFARQLMESYPDLPVEEDGRLNDAPLRENFIERVFAHADWQINVAESASAKSLVDFHSRHKYQLMAHSYQAYRELGRQVANHEKIPLDEVKPKYFTEFMRAMKKLAGRKKHTNVLQHIQGYFKKNLNTEEKAELSQLIYQYRDGLVPLLAPVTLLTHHLKKYPSDYLSQQTYFAPYPLEMGLNG